MNETAARIAVVDYGIGNLASAHKALVHLGADAELTSDAARVRDAAGVVVPGVGHFGACVRALRASGLEAPVREAVTAGRPVLGICVGLQMLFDASDEGDGREPGLGIIAGRVRRLSDRERLPQIGWNTVEVAPRSQLFAGLGAAPWMYFVHSYAPVPADDGIVTGWCTYGERFACAIERDNVWAVQFHPEKSGTNGLRLLENFVRAVTAPVVAAR